jgi:protein-S-isoprenylcysteine O-methyltransferase Ste14
LSTRIFSLSLVGAQFACVAAAVWPFVPFEATDTGVVLVVAGVALATWTLAFNRPGNFNVLPEVKERARLITSGPYAYIRHPMYSALMLLTCGVVAMHASTRNLLALCALAVVLAAKARVEERRLEHAFGGYREYASRVGRFIPKLRRGGRT